MENLLGYSINMLLTLVVLGSSPRDGNHGSQEVELT